MRAMEAIELYDGHSIAMVLSIVTIVPMKKDVFAVSRINVIIFITDHFHFQLGTCVNNLYSCPPEDDIRCDLACKMLHYVPCKTIQDRRACIKIHHDCKKKIFQLFRSTSIE